MNQHSIESLNSAICLQWEDSGENKNVIMKTEDPRKKREKIEKFEADKTVF